MPRMLLTLALVTMLHAAASPVPDFPFIAVSGGAEVEVPPDKATIHFKVLVHGAESEAAAGTVNDTLKKLVEGIVALGVDKGGVTADDLEREAVREQDENRNLLKVLGYDVSREVKVEIADMTKYTPAIDLIMKSAHVTSVSSEFDTRKRDEIDAELMGKACADAKRKALLMSKGVGTELGEVFAISDREFTGLPERFGFGYDSMRSGGMLPDVPVLPVFVPAKIKIRGEVEVLYRLGAATKEGVPASKE
jgi:uncharacterized protein